DGIRDFHVTGVQTCALPIYLGQFYYAAAFIFFGYLVGTLSMPVGIILVSGPLIGMIFFELRYVVPACVISVLGLIALTYVSAFEIGRASCRERGAVWVVDGE